MSIHIDSARLNESLQKLNAIGSSATGMQRLAYSKEDIEGRRYITNLMMESDLEVRTDAAGNIIGRREGSVNGLPAIAMGSHTDTVPDGGKYDGALGVLGAIETIRTLNDACLVTRHPIEVINFSNEEGTGDSRWLYGSRAMAGLLTEEDIGQDATQRKVIAGRLEKIGGNLSRINSAFRDKSELRAYLELHIEQGPILYQTGIQIGLVTAITGKIALKVCVGGVANHAGTTPMDGRRDPLLAASHIIQNVNKIAAVDHICRVATVGNLVVTPGQGSVIPGNVNLDVEFRDVEMNKMDEAEFIFRDYLNRLEEQVGVSIIIERYGSTQPQEVALFIKTNMEIAAKQLGFTALDMPSGAGHDAQAIAHLTEVGMIFVPSLDGISHSPEEYSSPEDCANGTNVLLRSLIAIDKYNTDLY
jgi:N-carbamoyl-L-amino-acid hydrolase